MSRLSPREGEVLRHLAQGFVNAAIAERLHVSLSTVEKHVNAIMDKLDLPRDPDYSRRVLAVLRYLNERGDVAASRLTAVAFGHQRPLIDPSRPEARTLNKRVDIVVVSGADDATRALFDEVLADRGISGGERG